MSTLPVTPPTTPTGAIPSPKSEKKPLSDAGAARAAAVLVSNSRLGSTCSPPTSSNPSRTPRNYEKFRLESPGQPQGPRRVYDDRAAQSASKYFDRYRSHLGRCGLEYDNL